MPPSSRTGGEREVVGWLRRWGRALRLTLMVAVTAAVTVWLIEHFGGSGGFLAVMRRARPWWVAASFSMASAAVVLGTVRWQLVLGAMRYPLSFGRALTVVLATWPLAVVTPSRANDFLRAFAVRRAVPLAEGTGSILAEKVVDLSVLLALGAIGAGIGSLWLWSVAIAAALVAEIGAVALLSTHRGRLSELAFARPYSKTIDDLFIAFDALRRAPATLASVCLVSLLIRGLTLGITYALLRAVDADVDLVDTCALWPAAMIVGLIPVTLAGMGTRDAAFLYLLAARGHLLAHASVLAATMGYSVVAIGSFAVIGLPFMARESWFESRT